MGWLRAAARRRTQWVLDGYGPGMGLKKQFRSPAEGEFLFEINDTPLEEILTSFGGWPLFLRTARSLGLAARVHHHLQLKQRRWGLDEASCVESFLALTAVGGECFDDFDVLREDAGMAAMLGYEPPSPEAARKFPCQFHDQEKIEQAQQQQLDLARASIIPGESEALAGLAAVNRDVIGELGRRSARGPRLGPCRTRSPSLKTPSAPQTNSRSLLRTDYGGDRPSGAMMAIPYRRGRHASRTDHHRDRSGTAGFAPAHRRRRHSLIQTR